jgi:hypothetical protein
MIEIVVEPKAVYVPLYYQPLYKVAQILLILNYNGGKKKKASISFIHTIAWAMREDDNLEILLQYKKGKRNSLVSWCYEPVLERALIIAFVNNYCERLKTGEIKLTIDGQSIVDKILLHNLFQKERDILSRIGEINPKSIDHNQKWDSTNVHYK